MIYYKDVLDNNKILSIGQQADNDSWFEIKTVSETVLVPDSTYDLIYDDGTKCPLYEAILHLYTNGNLNSNNSEYLNEAFGDAAKWAIGKASNLVNRIKQNNANNPGQLVRKLASARADSAANEIANEWNRYAGSYGIDNPTVNDVVSFFKLHDYYSPELIGMLNNELKRIPSVSSIIFPMPNAASSTVSTTPKPSTAQTNIKPSNDNSIPTSSNTTTVPKQTNSAKLASTGVTLPKYPAGELSIEKMEKVERILAQVWEMIRNLDKEGRLTIQNGNKDATELGKKYLGALKRFGDGLERDYIQLLRYDRELALELKPRIIRILKSINSVSRYAPHILPRYTKLDGSNITEADNSILNQTLSHRQVYDIMKGLIRVGINLNPNFLNQMPAHGLQKVSGSVATPYEPTDFERMRSTTPSSFSRRVPSSAPDYSNIDNYDSNERPTYNNREYRDTGAQQLVNHLRDEWTGRMKRQAARYLGIPSSRVNLDNETANRLAKEYLQLARLFGSYFGNE